MTLKRTMLAIAIAAAGWVGVAACGSQTSPGAAESADWRAQVVEFSDAHGPLVLPRQLPARLSQVQALTLDSQPAVTFYVPGEPLITVCSGDLHRCRNALGTSRELRTNRVDGLAFVVALGAREDPAAVPTLTPDDQSFWAEVPMTSSRPNWATSAR